jgi:hypothetical protein
MKKLAVIGLSVLALATWSGAALAQTRDFTKGTFAIGAERMSGFIHGKATTERNTPVGKVSASRSEDRFSLMGMETTGPWNLPRIGLDYFIIDHLSLGGTLYVGTGNDVTNVLFAPRVGYAIMFNDTVGLWPRGGIGYFHHSFSDNNGDDNNHFFNLDLECHLVIAFANGFGMTIGPVIDLSFQGSGTTTANLGPVGRPQNDYDQSYTSFGLDLGIFGWL